MSIKLLPRFVWIVPAILLVLAVARLTYGYCTFARIVVCGAAALIAISRVQNERAQQVSLTVSVLIAVLFNPFVPMRLDRATWLYIDLGASVLFLTHLLLVRQKAM